MTRLIKYLRPYVWWIILILLLLFGQAMADLSLPTYMSDIVNVGIQQDGIENAVPRAIRPAEFDRLSARGGSFVEFVRRSPLAGADLEVRRDRSPARRVKL